MQNLLTDLIELGALGGFIAAIWCWAPALAPVVGA